MSVAPVEPQIADVLHREGIDLALTVPCKYIAELIATLDGDDRFDLLYPTREEESVGIAAGAYLGGRKSVMLIQNSGLGNMVNAYLSLNRFYGIPLLLMASYRGDHLERVPAQNPMGEASESLLGILGIHPIVLETTDDLPKLEEGVARYAEKGEGVALLGRKTFWTIT